jgi:hypothetical protein
MPRCHQATFVLETIHEWREQIPNGSEFLLTTGKHFLLGSRRAVMKGKVPKNGRLPTERRN